MKRLPLVAFIVVLLGHATLLSWKAYQTANLWGASAGLAGGIRSYLASGDWWLGLSYALSAAFVTYAFLRLRSDRKAAGVGVAGGVTTVGVLYFAGCFLLGCCGSPMLVVYLSLFGSSFLGFTKPLVFVLTVISLGLAYLWMERRAKAGCVDCACETGLSDDTTAC